jgi:hypothetical protein
MLELISAALKAFGAFFGYQSSKAANAQRADLVKAKTAQEQQDLDDLIVQLTNTAMTDPDPKRRAVALEALRRMDSEEG